MNHAIHPEYINCAVSCSCGNSFTTRSTRKLLKIEICGQCHPFYTGRQKFVDTAGRIQRFQQKYAWTGDAVQKAAEHKKTKRPAARKPGDDDF